MNFLVIFIFVIELVRRVRELNHKVGDIRRDQAYLRVRVLFTFLFVTGRQPQKNDSFF